MSTAAYQVRVQSLRSARGKTTCVLEVLTLPAVDTHSVCISRSFVLHALFEATYDASPCPLATILNAQKKKNFFVAPEWYRANLDRFVLSTRLVSRKNHDVDLDARWEKLDQAKTPAARLAAAWRTAHTYRLEAVLASPDWAVHLRKGTEWGTTADDWWPDDPASAPRPDSAPAPAPPAKPAPATAKTDLNRVLAGLAHVQKNGPVTFQGSAKVVSIYQRALRLDPAESLDPGVEHARLRLLNDQVCRERRDAMAALARFWVLGGPGFFLEVLKAKLGPVVVVGASMPGSTWRIPAEAGSNLQLWNTEFKNALARALAQLPAHIVGQVRERARELAGKDPAAAMTVRALFPA